MSASAVSPKSPRQLYQIAKRQGIWDPEQIPIAEDRAHWEHLTPGQKEQLLKVCALFYEGEVSVSDTLAWFIAGMQEPDRRAFLTTQMFEEVKHAEFFHLYFRDVFGQVDTAAYLVPEYRGVLLDELKARGEAIGRALLSGSEPELEQAMVIGFAHYMGIVEGGLAVTGYQYFEEMLGSRGIFPRLLEGIQFIRADEGRHLTHGMDYLRQKIAQKPSLAGPVRRLFWSETLKIPARTQVVFRPNDFGLSRIRMMTLAYSHMKQRQRECGVA